MGLIVDAQEYQERCWIWIGCYKPTPLPCIESIDGATSPIHDCDALASPARDSTEWSGEAPVEEIVSVDECPEPTVGKPDFRPDAMTGQWEYEALPAADSEWMPSDELREALAMHSEDVASWCMRCDENNREREVRAQPNRETLAMLAEDVAAWCIRETCVENLPPRDIQYQAAKATPSNQEMVDDGLGRVIVKAQMTFRDAAGVSVILDHSLLELHVHERSVDAARKFLENNELKPHVIVQILDPLTKWLEEQVQGAPPEMASEAYQVEGDFND